MAMLDRLGARRTGVVDDDKRYVEYLCDTVRFCGLEPVPLRLLPDLESMSRSINEQVDAVICDHRLYRHSDVDYVGAQLLAHILSAGRPGLLITQFNELDCNTSIRQFRREIPVVISRHDLDDVSLLQGLEDCIAEQGGQIQPWRRPWRTLVSVEDKRYEDGMDVVDVIVPGWRRDDSVRFPLSLIPTKLRGHIQRDACFFAKVNIGSEKKEDLFFYDFELAPDPDPEPLRG